jgi:hypothetical protein
MAPAVRRDCPDAPAPASDHPENPEIEGVTREDPQIGGAHGNEDRNGLRQAITRLGLAASCRTSTTTVEGDLLGAAVPRREGRPAGDSVQAGNTRVEQPGCRISLSRLRKIPSLGHTSHEGYLHCRRLRSLSSIPRVAKVSGFDRPVTLSPCFCWKARSADPVLKRMTPSMGPGS